MLGDIIDYDRLVAYSLNEHGKYVVLFSPFEIFLQWTPYMDGIEVSYKQLMSIMFIRLYSTQIDAQPYKAFREGRVASVPVIMVNISMRLLMTTIQACVKCTYL